MAEEYERFIDADEQEIYKNETISYETIIIKQIQRCVDILSQEEFGGYYKPTVRGEGTTYVEDIKEQIINSVETLRMLLNSFSKEKSEELKEKFDEIKDYQEKLGEETIFVRGDGNVKIKDVGALDKNHPIMKQFIDFKCQKYREMFEILVNIYNRKKLDIAAASIE